MLAFCSGFDSRQLHQYMLVRRHNVTIVAVSMPRVNQKKSSRAAGAAAKRKSTRPPLTLADLYDHRFLERFRSRVRVADWGCLEWIGPRDENGYGMVTVAGRSIGAYRVAWMLHHHQLVPPGLAIDHLCCHRPCVSAHHLEAVTPAENSRRVHRPAPGWIPIPEPALTQFELNSRRRYEVQWMALDGGRLIRRGRDFASVEEAHQFMQVVRTTPCLVDPRPYKPIDMLPAVLRAGLLSYYGPKNAHRWLVSSHRQLGSHQTPLDLIKAGRFEELEALIRSLRSHEHESA